MRLIDADKLMRELNNWKWAVEGRKNTALEVRYIKECMERVKHQPQVNLWLRAKDILPPENKEVVIRSTTGNVTNAFRENGHWFTRNYTLVHDDRITHWADMEVRRCKKGQE